MGEKTAEPVEETLFLRVYGNFFFFLQDLSPQTLSQMMPVMWIKMALLAPIWWWIHFSWWPHPTALWALALSAREVQKQITSPQHKHKTILFDGVNQNNWTAQTWDHLLHVLLNMEQNLTLQLCCYRFKHTTEKEPQRSYWCININARQFRYYSAIAGWWDHFW